MNKLKAFTIIISSIFLLESCDFSDKRIQLLEIIESDLIKNNQKDFFYINKRDKDVLIYNDSSNINYLYDMDSKRIISVIKEGKQITFSKEDEINIVNKIKTTKEKMDKLKIKSIYPDKKFFKVETNILSDSTFEMLSRHNLNYKDLNYEKSKGDYFFGLINFKNTNLNDNLVNEYKKDFNLQKLDGSWYYYRFQR